MRGRAVTLPPSGTSVASQVCPSRALAPTFRRVRRRGHALSRAGTSTHYRKCAAEACHRATGGRLWPVGWRMWCYIPATRLRFSVLAVAVASTPNARPDDRQVRTTSHSGEPTREPEHRQNDASPLLAGGSRQSTRGRTFKSFRVEVDAPEGCQHGTHTNGTAYTRGTYSSVDIRHKHTQTRSAAPPARQSTARI